MAYLFRDHYRRDKIVGGFLTALLFANIHRECWVIIGGIMSLTKPTTDKIKHGFTILSEVIESIFKKLMGIPSVTNVVDFGADPTGVVSSKVAIDKAITSAGIGGVVYFPKGIYVTQGNHNLLQGQTLKGYGVTFKSDLSITADSLFNIEQDNISILGNIIIDGGMYEIGDRYPDIITGIRVGSTHQVTNFTCDKVTFIGSVYGLWITSLRDSVISNCYAFRCGNGFGLASNTTGILDINGVYNVKFSKCVAEECGYTFLGTDQSPTTSAKCGFKITDIAIRNLVYEDCVARRNYTHGFNYHGHNYSSVPDGFIQEGIHYIRCISDDNNIPEQYTKESDGNGLSSGFYIGIVGVPVHNITLQDCYASGNNGEALYQASLDSTQPLIGLSISNFCVKGSPRVKTKGIRSNNSIVKLDRVRDLNINGIPLRNVQGLYDYVIYCTKLSGTLSVKGNWDVGAPKLMYANAVNNTKTVIRDITHSYTSSLNTASVIAIELVDFSEIIVDNITLSNKSTTKMSHGIFQRSSSFGITSCKINNTNIFGGTGQFTVGVETTTVGGSKLFQGCTLQNCTNGFAGNNGENAIFIGNHFVTGTVITPLLSFAPSVIKRGNFGLEDS
ncbi:hypothetical protein [Proteus phage PM 116]|uniref:Rhamnogalacturonase A/B/Epimerase-like pectate lyase domain-containing protein n=1 Tax=Proteus phage PM 116 TaxID=1837877 RepID=A0A2D0VK16_9CAUD|nr:hypothetical protein HOS11_gp48 [Proteus phage PM 116]ANU80130.1 hypothetical protein [Proteus phage PM 116]